MLKIKQTLKEAAFVFGFIVLWDGLVLLLSLLFDV